LFHGRSPIPSFTTPQCESVVLAKVNQVPRKWAEFLNPVVLEKLVASIRKDLLWE
jgi:hypothetical protein